MVVRCYGTCNLPGDTSQVESLVEFPQFLKHHIIR